MTGFGSLDNNRLHARYKIQQLESGHIALCIQFGCPFIQATVSKCAEGALTS